jgi:predicted ferric reductase
LPAVRLVWFIYLLIFVGVVIRYRIVKPLRLWGKPWEVVENKAELGNAHTLRLRPVDHGGFTFEPGQFGWINVGRTPFNLEQHPISFSSNGDNPAGDGEIAFTIKSLGDWSGTVVPGIPPGTRVFVDGPYGVFSMDREQGPGYVLIGGGVGITPLHAMLLAMAEREDVRPVILFYGTSTLDDLTFRDELEGLAKTMNLKVVVVLSKPPEGWTGETGYITADVLRRYLPKQYKRFQFFICGPTPLMDAMEKALPDLGVPADKIHTERFDMV